MPSEFTETVTIRRFAGGKLINPEEVLACPLTNGQTGFAIKKIFLFEAGSEVTQADGTKWIVQKSFLADAETRMIVVKK